LGYLDGFMLAGFLSLLCQLLSWLLVSSDLQVQMVKAAMVSIELAHLRGEPHGVLNWMITPKLLE